MDKCCQVRTLLYDDDYVYAACNLGSLLLYCISRDCVKDMSPTSPLYESMLPSGGIMQSLLQYVWSLWEDPVDVSV